MQFDISSSELQKHLQIAAGAISSNPVLPILEDFLFTVEGGNLTIASSNLELTVVTKLPVNADKDGMIAIPAKILLDTLKALPDQPITIKVDDDARGVEIKSSYGKYKLAGDAPDDFPEVPAENEADTITLSAGNLLDAINRSVFAASNDELRLAMTGVYVQVDFNKIIFVATDAHKLVKYTFSTIETDVAASFILPKKALTLLRSAIFNAEDVKISFDKKNAFFEFGDQRVICRLVDAKYPDYNAVIPVENPHTLTLNRKDFQNSLKRIAIYANKTTNQVLLNISEGSVTISAQDLDFSNEATETLSCAYDGEPMTIGFNAKFLIEMLGVIEHNEVKLELSTPNRAGILLPGEQEENEYLLMLVMPVMMSN
jgi:DNA polymerase-3 subunit beta